MEAILYNPHPTPKEVLKLIWQIIKPKKDDGR